MYLYYSFLRTHPSSNLSSILNFTKNCTISSIFVSLCPLSSTFGDLAENLSGDSTEYFQVDYDLKLRQRKAGGKCDGGGIRED